MNSRFRLFVLVGLFAMLSADASQAQEGAAPPPQQGQGQDREGGGRQGGPRPLFGKITAVHDGSIDVVGQDGQTVTVKITPQTEFRKDREQAKITDFKVGDMVAVRGDKNADNTVTATAIGARTGGPGGGGFGGRPGGGGMALGTLGKDYVAGEVKSIDAPKLTVVRTDNVTQTLELNEETSLRRGRENITMADIKVGDHVMARGVVQNDVFVPKGLMVVSPEQWQRMQEMMVSGGNGAKPNGTEAPAPKPQE
jgi:Cu/Ag efflux protein CusF